MKIARRVAFLSSLFLLPLAAFAGSPKTWTGAGGNALWSNAANWDSGTAPANGDDLVFAGQSTTNDLTGLSLSSVTITSGSPSFSGNAVSVGVLHVNGGAFLLLNWPFNVISKNAIAGGTLKLQSTSIGDATVTSGTLEVTREKGSSNAASLTLDPSARYAVDLYETFWGTSADYLAVHGDISLGGSTLVVNPGTGFPGQTHTLIRNDGPNPISGTFQDLPEGATFLHPPAPFRITYRGGSSGRDVAIRLLGGSSTKLTLSHSSLLFGSPLTLTANVRGSYGLGTLVGAAEFFDGATSLGTAVISDAGLAKITTYGLTPGAHNLTAFYPGAEQFGPSTSDAVTYVVVPYQAGTTTTLSGTPLTGQSLTFTALVQATGLTPTGTVTFIDGGTSLATVPLDNTGKGTLARSLPNGTHSITATFDGSSNFQKSISNTLTETVDVKLPTQTALSVSPNPAMAGTPVVLRATVYAASGSPLGTVTFMDGLKPLGDANVGSDQTASFPTETLTTGLHSLSALYLGADGFSASSSTPFEQLITAPRDCAPVISVPPVDTTLSPGGTATMTVGIAGAQPQTIQWYIGTYPDVSRPIGSTATITITDTWTSEDVWVHVRNSCGSAHASAHINAPIPTRQRTARH
jgi:hypothetical protein